MDEINLRYKYAFLFEGEYRNGKIIFDKKRSILIKLIIFIDIIFVITHLIVFFFDDYDLKDHLVYLKLSSSFGSRFLNLAGGYIIFSMSYSVLFYRKFTHRPNGFKVFSFLFCSDAEKMQKKYHLSKTGSKNLIDFQKNFFKTTDFINRYCFYSFWLLFSKNCYESLIKSPFNVQYLNYLVDLMKILGYCLLSISFWSLSGRFFIIYFEGLIFLRYLTIRLKDQIEIFYNLSADRLINKKYIFNTVTSLSWNYNSILKRKRDFDKHINNSMFFITLLLLLSVLYPILIIFESNKKQLIIYFYSINLICVYIFFSILCYYNMEFLNAVSRTFINSIRANEILFFRTLNF